MTSPTRTNVHAHPASIPSGVTLLLALGLATTLAAGCRSSGGQDLKAEGFDQNPVGVPPEAKLVRHQRGERGILDPNSWFSADNTTFKPKNGGRVWVVNQQNGTTVYSGRLQPGDEMVVSPRTNDVLVNRGKVNSRRLPEDTGFLIYYAPEAAPPQTQGSQVSPATPAG